MTHFLKISSLLGDNFVKKYVFINIYILVTDENVFSIHDCRFSRMVELAGTIGDIFSKIIKFQSNQNPFDSWLLLIFLHLIFNLFFVTYPVLHRCSYSHQPWVKWCNGIWVRSPTTRAHASVGGCVACVESITRTNLCEPLVPA